MQDHSDAMDHTDENLIEELRGLFAKDDPVPPLVVDTAKASRGWPWRYRRRPRGAAERLGARGGRRAGARPRHGSGPVGQFRRRGDDDRRRDPGRWTGAADPRSALPTGRGHGRAAVRRSRGRVDLSRGRRARALPCRAARRKRLPPAGRRSRRRRGGWGRVCRDELGAALASGCDGISRGFLASSGQVGPKKPGRVAKAALNTGRHH